MWTITVFGIQGNENYRPANFLIILSMILSIEKKRENTNEARGGGKGQGEQ